MRQKVCISKAAVAAATSLGASARKMNLGTGSGWVFVDVKEIGSIRQ